MSIEVIQAIGQWIVEPICTVAAVALIFYFATKD